MNTGDRLGHGLRVLDQRKYRWVLLVGDFVYLGFCVWSSSNDDVG
jgi:hypothetical protein